MKRCRISRRLSASSTSSHKIMRLPVPLDRRVARPVAVAAVERQKLGLPAPQPGRHPHLIRVNREVDKRALLETEEKIAPVALVLVLAHRIGGPLPGERVLEFGGNDGNAVDAQGLGR